MSDDCGRGEDELAMSFRLEIAELETEIARLQRDLTSLRDAYNRETGISLTAAPLIAERDAEISRLKDAVGVRDGQIHALRIQNRGLQAAVDMQVKELHEARQAIRWADMTYVAPDWDWSQMPAVQAALKAGEKKP